MARSSRKQEILQAALACFTEFGVEATTIEMIRDRSGASIGSLYHHFGNRERIIAALEWKAPWFLVSGLAHEGTRDVMRRVQAELDEQARQAAEAADAEGY